MTEKEMRESEVPTFNTIEELSKYILDLQTQEHDYGTCVYAMSMAAVATFNYIARKLGVTGFQASCADLDILKRIRRITGPFKIIDFDKALYPQYNLIKDLQDNLNEIKPWLKEEAKKKLANTENRPAHPDVKAHWEKLANE